MNFLSNDRKFSGEGQATRRQRPRARSSLLGLALFLENLNLYQFDGLVSCFSSKTLQIVSIIIKYVIKYYPTVRLSNNLHTTPHRRSRFSNEELPSTMILVARTSASTLFLLQFGSEFSRHAGLHFRCGLLSNWFSGRS